jgi:2'-5' RNA ligase
MRRVGGPSTGQLRLVLIPDERTAAHATALSERFSSGNMLSLGTRHPPHLTLYHAKLKEVPALAAQFAMQAVAATLPIPLRLTMLAPFGDKFLFWDAIRDPALLALHAAALELSRYLDAAGQQQSDKEGLTLSRLQRENVAEYGHPLVGELWRPHITVGYFPASFAPTLQREVLDGTATGVAFVRVGDAGAVAEVLGRIDT